MNHISSVHTISKITKRKRNDDLEIIESDNICEKTLDLTDKPTIILSETLPSKIDTPAVSLNITKAPNNSVNITNLSEMLNITRDELDTIDTISNDENEKK